MPKWSAVAVVRGSHGTGKIRIHILDLKSRDQNVELFTPMFHELRVDQQPMHLHMLITLTHYPNIKSSYNVIYMNSSQLELIQKMVPISQNDSKCYKVRSISFPARSSGHALEDTISVAVELEKFYSWLSTSLPQADTLCNGLEGLNELYNSMKQLLVTNSPQALQALSNSQYEKWVEEMIEESMIYVDICGKARDAISQVSECIGEFQSALRRKKGNKIDIESNVEGYTALRKNMKKGMEKALQELRQMEHKMRSLFTNNVGNDQLLELIRVLRGAGLASNLVLQKLLLFLSIPIVKPKTSKWFLAKLVAKSADSVLECVKNEFEDVDAEVMNLPIHSSMQVNEDDQSVNSALEKLESLDMSMKAFELGLESLFKNLVYLRVTYLNIYSQ